MAPDIPPSYDTSREEAAAKESLAHHLDAWAAEIERLCKNLTPRPGDREVVPTGGGHSVWSGDAANRFNDQLTPIHRDLVALPGAFRQSAHNLRAAAAVLRRPENRNT